MISVNLSASCDATGCHITCVDENPCSSSSGGPLPPTRAKMRPDEVLIHSEAYPGNRSARSGMDAPLLQTLFVVAAGRPQGYAILQVRPTRTEETANVDRF